MNKRKYKRKEKPFMVRFRTIPSPDWDIVAVKNLSAGGMVYDYNKDYNKNLELDSLLDLKIDFFKSIPSINCIGRVVRIDKTQHTSMYGIAVKFTEIDEKEKEMINTTVEAILRKEVKKKEFLFRKTRENEKCHGKKSSNSRSKARKLYNSATERH